MIHEVMSSCMIVQVAPGTQKSVRPCCFGSGLQILIRSRVPGRIGPTPRQLLPDATLWRHIRAFVSNGLTTSARKVSRSPCRRRRIICSAVRYLRPFSRYGQLCYRIRARPECDPECFGPTGNVMAIVYSYARKDVLSAFSIWILQRQFYRAQYGCFGS